MLHQAKTVLSGAARQRCRQLAARQLRARQQRGNLPVTPHTPSTPIVCRAGIRHSKTAADGQHRGNCELARPSLAYGSAFPQDAKLCRSRQELLEIGHAYGCECRHDLRGLVPAQEAYAQENPRPLKTTVQATSAWAATERPPLALTFKVDDIVWT